MTSALGRINLLCKLLLVLLGREWKLTVMHASLRGETSTTQASSLACSSRIGQGCPFPPPNWCPEFSGQGPDHYSVAW